ncbi:AraC family transcriptional regulator [Symbiopectobacterium sp. Eva_TO]
MITYRDGWFELALLENTGGFPRHTHDEYVISANLNGVEHVWLDGNTFDVDPQMVTTYNPHQLQSGDNSDGRWQCASLYVQPGAFEHFFGRAFRFAQGVQQAPVLAQQLKLLANPSDEQSDGAMYQERLVMLLAALMDNDMGSPAPLKMVSEGSRVKRIKARLLDCLAEQPNLDTLARDEHITVAHLVRSFHQEAGMPPLAWLMQRRIGKARELLRQGMSISEVALSLGFADQSHFTKTFNRFNAMTPGRFQRINF